MVPAPDAVKCLGCVTTRLLATKSLPLPSERMACIHMMRVALSLTLDQRTGTTVCHSLLSEHETGGQDADGPVSHLVVLSLCQKFSGAHAGDAFPSLFPVREAGEAVAAAKVETQPGKLPPFSQLPFLLVPF